MAEENCSCINNNVWLPKEVQQEILVRLPSKSVIRFESVCKTWLVMLRSRGFIDLYAQRGQLISDPDELHSIPLEDLFEMVPGLFDYDKANAVEIVYCTFGPLNGIHCVTVHDLISGCYSIMTGKIALWNPATHAYKFANQFPRKFHSLLSNLSSKRARLHWGFGTCISSSSNLDYRVVALLESEENDPSVLVLVYSVQRGTWKKIVDYVPGKRNDGKRKATDAFNKNNMRIKSIKYPWEVCPQRFFEGCYYWKVTVATSDHETAAAVLSFNFAHQSFELIDGPPVYYEYQNAFPHDATNGEQVNYEADVFVLHDHLALLQLHKVVSSNGIPERTVGVAVWMMMEYGVEQSWTMIYTSKPNFHGSPCALYGIHYDPLQSGGVCIKNLLFKDSETQVVSWVEEDEDGNKDGSNANGGYVKNDGMVYYEVCLNTFGISTYIETLERL